MFATVHQVYDEDWIAYYSQPDFKKYVELYYPDETMYFDDKSEIPANLDISVNGVHIEELVKEFSGADKKKIKLINIYVPNGNPIDSEKYEYKKRWLTSFVKKIKKELSLNPNLILSGDFNIIPEEIDVHDYTRYENDALFKIEIRKKFREVLNLGFVEIKFLIEA